ncbi:hypothetical protein BT67DRAFT_279499 [Trichocladium antarcticum]|uniref:Uncharacterized protein n=1 Tax=Trichocladium antarcticum TaxID=1450529 RepID=A0AAN6UM06_9PEZI|nr:hypothetical protein BT67DRAFT_279499 [Trichocladium antarcticum]
MKSGRCSATHDAAISCLLFCGFRGHGGFQKTNIGRPAQDLSVRPLRQLPLEPGMMILQRHGKVPYNLAASDFNYGYHKAPPYSGKTVLGMVLANQTDLRNEGRFSQYMTVTRAISAGHGHFLQKTILKW